MNQNEAVVVVGSNNKCRNSTRLAFGLCESFDRFSLHDDKGKQKEKKKKGNRAAPANDLIYTQNLLSQYAPLRLGAFPFTLSTCTKIVQ